MKFVCVHCETSLIPMRIGASVIEMFSDPPQPYKIWSSDVWECPKCHAEIAVGVGPTAQHHEKDFSVRVAEAKQPVYDYERRKQRQ